MIKKSMILAAVMVFFTSTASWAGLVDSKKANETRRKTLMSVARQADNDGRAAIPKIFGNAVRSFDTDRNGWIDREEARTMMRTIR